MVGGVLPQSLCLRVNTADGLAADLLQQVHVASRLPGFDKAF